MQKLETCFASQNYGGQKVVVLHRLMLYYKA